MKFVKGMDLSTLLELEKCGAHYYVDGMEMDILDIMKSMMSIRSASVSGTIRGLRAENPMAQEKMILKQHLQLQKSDRRRTGCVTEFPLQ